MEKPAVLPPLARIVQQLEAEQELITPERREELIHFVSLIRESLSTFGQASITVICTHNSRRSQLTQVWLKTAAIYFGFKGLHLFSGGTEETAFNHRMVEALRRAGFEVAEVEGGENPKYPIPVADQDPDQTLYFSKTYDHPHNPAQDFIAVMVCTQADEGCPFVPGAFKRFSLPYLDPKEADNTPAEAATYDAKVREIGREMIFVVKALLP